MTNVCKDLLCLIFSHIFIMFSDQLTYVLQIYEFYKKNDLPS